MPSQRGEMRATPRNPVMGAAADLLARAQGLDSPVLNLLLGGAPQAADDLSYQGGSPFTGTGMTTQVRPEMLDLAMIGPDARDLLRLAPGLLGPLLKRLPDRVGNVRFDPREGMGAEPVNKEMPYFGMAAMMRPGKFRELALPLENELLGRPSLAPDDAKIVQAIAERMRGGVPVSPSTLWLDMTGKTPRIVGHEGRHRAVALEQLLGPEAEVPVHLIPRGQMQGHHITDDMIQELSRGAFSEALPFSGSGSRYVPELYDDWWINR